MRGTIGLCRASWLGVGSAMLLACSSNDTSTIAGRADGIVELGLGVALALAGACVAAVTRRSLRHHQDLELRASTAREAAVRSRVADEAHPIEHRR